MERKPHTSRSEQPFTVIEGGRSNNNQSNREIYFYEFSDKDLNADGILGPDEHYDIDIPEFMKDYSRSKRNERISRTNNYDYVDDYNDDIDGFRDDFDDEKNYASFKRKLIRFGVGVTATLAIAGAIYGYDKVHTPKVTASDEVVHLTEGGTWWNQEYVPMAEEWNAEHPDKPIDPRFISYAFDKVNPDYDHSKVPMPGDAKIKPELTEQGLFD